MSFLTGFSKVAAFGHSNQGLEMKEYDTEPSNATGAGGMSPSGIETYQPLGEDQKGSRDKAAQRQGKSKSGMRDKEVAHLLVHKLSSAKGDSYATSGQGSRAGIAGTGVTQLKYESSTPWSLEQIGESFAGEKEQHSRYERARRK
jgi:hypothetical protein